MKHCLGTWSHHLTLILLAKQIGSLQNIISEPKFLFLFVSYCVEYPKCFFLFVTDCDFRWLQSKWTQCSGVEKPPWQLSCSWCRWSGSLSLPFSFLFFAFPLFVIDADCRRHGCCATLHNCAIDLCLDPLFRSTQSNIKPTKKPHYFI